MNFTPSQSANLTLFLKHGSLMLVHPSMVAFTQAHKNLAPMYPLLYVLRVNSRQHQLAPSSSQSAVINYNLYLYRQNKMANSLSTGTYHITLYIYICDQGNDLPRQHHVQIHKSSLAGFSVISAHRLRENETIFVRISLVELFVCFLFLNHGMM